MFFMIREMDRDDDEEGREQQSGSMGSEDSIEGNNKMKSTEDEAPESSDNDDGKENGKSKEDAEPKGEFSAENVLRQRRTSELSPLLV